MYFNCTMKTKLFATIYLDREEAETEVEVEVTGFLYRGNPRHWEDDPSEIFNLVARDTAGNVVELSEEEVEQAEEALFKTLE